MADLGFALDAPLGGEAPSCEDLTEDERSVEVWLVALWPPGVRDLYDLDNLTSDVCNYFAALAQAFRTFGTSLVDNLRVELAPATAVEKLLDWETALGITANRRPTTSVAARQAAVVSKLREAGSYSRAELQAIVGPLLGYTDPTQLVVYETNRAALSAIHEVVAAGGPVPGPGSITTFFTIDDGPAVSAAGVRVRLQLTHASVASVGAVLTSPNVNGQQAIITWLPGTVGRGAVVATDLWLRSRSAAGLPSAGRWRLDVYSVATGGTLVEAGLMVEGAGRDSAGADGRGTEVFEWGAYADPTLERAASPSDRAAVLRTMSRVQPAHTRGALLTSVSPRPGGLVPSQFIPHANP